MQLSGAPVLVVQDDALVGLAVEMDLEAGGLGEAVTFRSGRQAQAWLESGSPSAAVLDWRLGDQSCLPVARLLRERGIPFVVLSESASIHAGHELRNARWFEKPTPTHLMAEAIAEMLPLAA